MQIPPSTEGFRLLTATPPAATPAVAAPYASQGARPTAAVSFQAVHAAAVEDAPPSELLADLDAAAVVAAQLEAAQRQLHFEVDKRTGALEVEVRDAFGNVVRRIPPTEALRVAMGETPPDKLT